MIRQHFKNSKQPRFAVLLNKTNSNSFTPTKRRDSDSQYDVNQSRRPEISKNTSQDRLATSPLKGPLRKAIQKTVRNISNKENEMDRSRRTYQSRVSKRAMEEENIDTILDQMHAETQNFLLKYFDPSRFHLIPIQKFIDNIIFEYQSLWNTQQAEQILGPFIQKLVKTIGDDYQERVDLRLLQLATSESGVIGLILALFRELKDEDERGTSRVSYNYNTLKQSFEEQLEGSSDVQNIKNIVQEFMESMYKCMENEVYAKFNVQMRRMVLRYKQSQKLLKIVNDKITNNIDVFTGDQRSNERIKALQAEIQAYKEIQIKNQVIIGKQREDSRLIRNQNDRFIAQIRFLRDQLDKLQSHLMKTDREPSLSPRPSISNIDPSVSRYTTVQSHISVPTVVQQLQKSTIKNTFSEFYEAPITTTTIQNTSSILTPTVQVSSYPMLVSAAQPEVKVQVIQHKEYLTTSPSRVVRTEMVPTTPSRVTVTRLQASPIKSRVIQLI